MKYGIITPTGGPRFNANVDIQSLFNQTRSLLIASAANFAGCLHPGIASVSSSYPTHLGSIPVLSQVNTTASVAVSHSSIVSPTEFFQQQGCTNTLSTYGLLTSLHKQSRSLNALEEEKKQIKPITMSLRLSAEPHEYSHLHHKLDFENSRMAHISIASTDGSNLTVSQSLGEITSKSRLLEEPYIGSVNSPADLDLHHFPKTSSVATISSILPVVTTVPFHPGLISSDMKQVLLPVSTDDSNGPLNVTLPVSSESDITSYTAMAPPSTASLPTLIVQRQIPSLPGCTDSNILQGNDKQSKLYTSHSFDANESLIPALFKQSTKRSVSTADSSSMRNPLNGRLPAICFSRQQPIHRLDETKICSAASSCISQEVQQESSNLRVLPIPPGLFSSTSVNRLGAPLASNADLGNDRTDSANTLTGYVRTSDTEQVIIFGYFSQLIFYYNIVFFNYTLSFLFFSF
ncbi:unnamed protein product [Protopolystoma xenopodis]|uniref:Uncharacterized protein n=1 Tax=Protopolystoma xenopodis TaxID=117903 RepID=A0A3S5AAT6_9PLAT|nr:unnamed protein product [Protopolystoma xenopodis]